MNIPRVLAFFVSAIVLMGLLHSCSLLVKEESEKPLARVHDNYLYPSQIPDLLKQATGNRDSLELIQNYLKKWVDATLLVEQAERSLNDDQKDVSEELLDYRNSLIIHRYRTNLIQEKLDTGVAMDEIQAYYDANQSNFELKEDIVKVRYVKVRKDAPRIRRLNRLFWSVNNKDKDELEEYCIQFAEDYNGDDSTWVPFDDVLKLVPFKPYNKEDFLRRNRRVELADSTCIYLLKINDYKIKNSISPLSFEQDRIRKIIINKRKLELIKSVEASLLKQAVEGEDFEIYATKEE